MLSRGTRGYWGFARRVAIEPDAGVYPRSQAQDAAVEPVSSRGRSLGGFDDYTPVDQPVFDQRSLVDPVRMVSTAFREPMARGN